MKEPCNKSLLVELASKHYYDGKIVTNLCWLNLPPLSMLPCAIMCVYSNIHTYL
jgi:hypothetical protein